MFLQPLDPSCRRQSIGRGFIISLPILIIYLLVYLLSFVLESTELGRHHLDTVARFWTYKRQEGLQDVAGLCTFVTSQFTHYRLAPLVMDSFVLIAIASVLGSVFNRRTFFAVYVLGGFLAAAVDCAWAWVMNPCQNLTQAQRDEISTSVRMIDEAVAKLNELKSSRQPFTWKFYVENLTNTELRSQVRIIQEQRPVIRDRLRWNELNLASSGSLICLMSVATLIRPRTIVNFWGVRPKFQLWKLTACFCAFSVYMHLVTNSRLNFSACLGGNLAAVPLWFLWLRKGHIGTLSSGLRAFDQLNKPAEMEFQNWVTFSAIFPIFVSSSLVHSIQDKKRKEAELEKEIRESDSQPSSVEAGDNPSGDPKNDAGGDDDKAQEETPASEPAAGDNDQAPRENKD